MLFAATLPLAALFVLEARSVRVRLLGAATLLLLAGSIAASGSRGAILAACAGVLLFGLAVARRATSRAVVVGAVVVAGIGLASIASIPQPLSQVEAAKVKNPSRNTEKYTANDAQYAIRLEDEIGYSGGYHAPSKSNFWSASGRLQAWRGALAQGYRRPLLGYGFGTEATVFVDRFQVFQGGVPENSFIGLFLQLGVVGVALFLGLVVALALAAVRSLRMDRALAAACIGVLGAGLVLSFVQSFFYAVGNVATLTLWVSAFVPAARASE
jgi:O-antigen ligase